MSMRGRTLVGSILLSLVSWHIHANAETAPMSRQEILQLGESVVGYSYWWGGAKWDPSTLKFPGRCEGEGCPECDHFASAGGPEYGSDCSGLVGHAWKLGGDSPLTGAHPHSTATFMAGSEDWSRIDRTDLLPGDALVKKGHIVLFEKWAADGNMSLFECAGCQYGCIHSTKSLGSEFVAIRRTAVDASAPSDPSDDDGGALTQATCDGIGGWAVAGDEPVEVLLTFDAPSGSYFAKRQTVTANQTGECGDSGSCEHAFQIPFPESMKDGKRHTIYAYAIEGENERLLLGAPVGVRCTDTGTTSGSGCSHSVCQAGTKLDSSCGLCTSSICLVQPSCCSTSWDQSCVDLVANNLGSCAGECAGGPSSCAHDECSSGAALSASCSSCAKNVCERDAFCCDKEWDFICAKEAAEDAYCDCGD